MLISRRRRLSKERKEKGEQKTTEEEQKLTEIAMEAEFGKLDDKIVVVDEAYFEDETPPEPDPEPEADENWWDD